VATSPTTTRDGDRRGTHDAPLEVLVVGAGFSGVGAVVRLRERGVTDVVVLEKGDDVGGVWRDNTYPGAACDVKSLLYSFSFAPHDWSRTYAPQEEILAYLRQVADEHDVTPHCRFGREVATADWVEETGTWQVTTVDGEVWVARVLVSGVGQLSRPRWPDLPGLADFAGPTMHSARWDHDLDLDGRRVAVVGTGASAIQFVPGIVDRVGHLTVFQRSAPWVLPKGDRPYRPWERRVLSRVPGARRLTREWIFWTNELRVLAFNSPSSWLGRASERLGHWHLQRQVQDPALREAVEPDHPIGCKRVLVSNDWYPALDRDHVDVETTPVGRVVEEGVITEDGRLVEADVLVLGTGFHATEFLVPMQVTGRDGRDLHEQWGDAARAHLGMTVPGFPNLFLLYGPNTNLGHNSIIFMIESQLRYLVAAVDHLRARPLISLEVRADVAAGHDAQVQDELASTVWNAGCSSWYRTAAGRVTNNWPGAAFRYRLATWHFEPDDHHHLPRGAPVPADDRPGVTAPA
jgi:cation diffusion facilitator CzcD-associated flavoprotein CzcO